MKKLLLVGAIALISMASVAQDDGGAKKMWLSGNVGFNSGSEGDNNTMDWSFGPEFGYMLNDKMALAIAFGMSGSSYKWDNDEEDKYSDLGFTPFFRYYITDGEKLKFFGQLNVPIAFGNMERTRLNGNNELATTKFEYTRFGVNVQPGLQYWFNDSWSMLATIGYLGFESQTDKDPDPTVDDVESSEFGLDVDFTAMNLGLVFHF